MRRLACLLLLAALPCAAQERITDFHSDIRIERTGELAVIERFTVQVEGAQVKRGILRDFPTGYRDGLGNTVNVPFKVERVTRNGAAEPFVLERLSNGMRVRIGSAQVLLPHGPHTYEIAYRTARQLGFFEDYDELYWNVNGNGWTLPFDRISAEVRLPQQIASSLVRAEAYTGLFGARGRSYTSFVRDGGAAFRSTRPFQPREGMTIVVSFPKGVVDEPTREQRMRWFLSDNRAAGVGMLGALLLVGFLYWRWSLVGRDPRSGPRFPRYEPPPGMGPAGVRYLHKQGFDAGCFGAALLGLGERGALKIRRSGESFALERAGTPDAWLPGEKPIVEALLPSEGARHVVEKTYDPDLRGALAGLKQELDARFKGLFSTNNGSILAGVALAVGIAIAMDQLGASHALLFAVCGVMALTVLLFKRWMPAYSVEGRKLQDHLDGLRQYLTVAEADELRRMKAPPQTGEEFARLLPYAVALDVEKTWAHRFTLLLGASAVAAAASHYYSSDSGFSGGGAGAGIGDSVAGLADTVSAAATPPGSSSGSSSDSGGGGSSGGGGGGGGGSGW